MPVPCSQSQGIPMVWMGLWVIDSSWQFQPRLSLASLVAAITVFFAYTLILFLQLNKYYVAGIISSLCSYGMCSKKLAIFHIFKSSISSRKENLKKNQNKMLLKYFLMFMSCVLPRFSLFSPFKEMSALHVFYVFQHLLPPWHVIDVQLIFVA